MESMGHILGELRPVRGRTVYGGLSAPLGRTVRRSLESLAEALSWILTCSLGT
jgi:hypothetical protein